MSKLNQLSELIQEIQADAWDEGYTASDEEAYFFSTHGRTPNPYLDQKDN